MGRPRATAPPGRLTLADAAKRLGVTRQYVHRLVADYRMSAVSIDGGAFTVSEADVDAFAASETFAVKADGDRVAAWRTAAGRKPVIAWLTELGDRASGYRRKR